MSSKTSPSLNTDVTLPTREAQQSFSAEFLIEVALRRLIDPITGHVSGLSLQHPLPFQEVRRPG